jgi:hypothetical protein
MLLLEVLVGRVFQMTCQARSECLCRSKATNFNILPTFAMNMMQPYTKVQVPDINVGPAGCALQSPVVCTVHASCGLRQCKRVLPVDVRDAAERQLAYHRKQHPISIAFACVFEDAMDRQISTTAGSGENETYSTENGIISGRTG